MSARDLLAASLWLIDREIAGAPLPHPSWETFRENDPETAMIYETQAGCHLAALSAAGYAVEQGWQPIKTAPRDAMLLLGHVEDTAPLVGYYHRGAWREHNGKGTPCKPTYWRPLPAPPEGQP